MQLLVQLKLDNSLLSLEFDIVDVFNKLGYGCVIEHSKKYYTIILNDADNEYRIKVKKMYQQQASVIIEHIIKDVKNQRPELFL